MAKSATISEFRLFLDENVVLNITGYSAITSYGSFHKLSYQITEWIDTTFL